MSLWAAALAPVRISPSDGFTALGLPWQRKFTVALSVRKGILFPEPIPLPPSAMHAKHITCQVDIKSREFEYLTVLKAIFQTNTSIDFNIVPQDPLWQKGRSSFFSTARRQTNLLITPSYHTRRSLASLAWKHMSASYLVHWHSEQLIDKWFFKDKLNIDNTAMYNRDVDYHLVWGNDFAQLLTRHAKVNPSKIYVVGCPKFDLLSHPFSYGGKSSKGQSRTVGFVSDFPLASMSDKEYEWTISHYKFPQGWNLRDLLKRAQPKFINTIKELAKQQPNLTILVRLHPGENLDCYESLRSFSNDQINSDGSFSDILSRCDLIVQFLSTSFFETRYCRKPVICLNLVNDFGDYWRDYFKYFDFVEPAEFLNNFEEIMVKAKNFAAETSQQDLEQLFSTHLGPSLPRTFNALMHILQRPCQKQRFSMLDRARIEEFCLRHRVKDCAGAMSFFLWKLGVLHSISSRVVEAERRHSSSGNSFTDREVTEKTKYYCSEYIDYLRDMSSKPARIELGQYGYLVTV